MTLILASSSPRRKELLTQLGLTFRIMTSNVKENTDRNVPPEELTVKNARKKSLSVAEKAETGDIVIGADTVVAADGVVYGKPCDTEEAVRMLAALNGREHQVVTGVAVVRNGLIWTDYAVTRVQMARLSDGEIERYVATGEPMDKAGAYAIQGIGALFIEEIAGCYFNVVGLPLHVLSRLLHKAGFDLL